jgi:hypothetical protein
MSQKENFYTNLSTNFKNLYDYPKNIVLVILT